jgi:hypothetical protein
VLDGLAFNAAHRSGSHGTRDATVPVHDAPHDDGDEWVAPTLPFPLPAVPVRARAVGE